MNLSLYTAIAGAPGLAVTLEFSAARRRADTSRARADLACALVPAGVVVLTARAGHRLRRIGLGLLAAACWASTSCSTEIGRRLPVPKRAAAARFRTGFRPIGSGATPHPRTVPRWRSRCRGILSSAVPLLPTCWRAPFGRLFRIFMSVTRCWPHSSAAILRSRCRWSVAEHRADRRRQPAAAAIRLHR